MSVTFPAGFRASGVTAGLKTSGKPDVAIVVSDGDPQASAAAAVFTSNRFDAAPVQWSRQVMEQARQGGPMPRAVVLNSGGANACTGDPGFADTEATAVHAAEALHLAPSQVLVCSTGIIGERLDMDKLLPGVTHGIDAATAGDQGGVDAAEAIMTTDTVRKTATRTSAGGVYRLGGMAKGAGMLAPGLATMLVVITTDAIVDPLELQAALAAAASKTFDRTDSDGCMSTNDTVILLASGASGAAADPMEFTHLLTELSEDLCRQLIGDAEGASHDVSVTVSGAQTEEGALAVARAISRSNLVKTAIAGEDPNWGRILSAAGTIPPEVVPFSANAVDVTFNGVTVCRGGGVGDPRDLVEFDGRQVTIEVNLHAGTAQVTILTNDLTHEYIHINADYSS